MSKIHICLGLNFATAVLWACCSPLILAISCDSSIYGDPIIQDCYEALYWIPSARLGPSDPISQQPRIFAEPQYLQTPFDGLNNVYSPHAIVQLPKIWKHSRSIFVGVRKPYEIPRRISQNIIQCHTF